MSTDESSSEAATEEQPRDVKKGQGTSEASAKEGPSSSVTEPLDEEKINAPSRQDLVMLGVICVSTLILWAAGRAACNYQVPGESLTPRRVSLEERTRTPKHVGIEFAQAIGGGDFDTAGKLTRGEAAAFVKKDRASCGACSQRKSVAEKLLSVGTVLKSNSVDSIVSVRTTGGGADTVRVLGIERDGRKWFVTRIYDSAEEAELKADPSADQAPAGLQRPEDDAQVEGDAKDAAAKETSQAETAATKPEEGVPGGPVTAPQQPAPAPKAPHSPDPESGVPPSAKEDPNTAGP